MTSGAVGNLVGREDELARIRELLNNARHRVRGALVVRGEAGIGKTALLGHVARSAADMRVLPVRGIESESERPFGALVELVGPVEGFVSTLPDQLAEALRGSLALGPAVEAPRLRIGVAVLGLLELRDRCEPRALSAPSRGWAWVPRCS